MEHLGESPHWVSANDHSRLGLPVQQGTRHRFFKRLAGRINATFFRPQAQFNADVLALLSEIQDGQLADRQSLIARIEGLEKGQISHYEVLVRHEEPLARHEQVLVQFVRDTENSINSLEASRDAALDFGLELARVADQSFARYQDAIGTWRRELGVIARDLAEVRATTHDLRDQVVSEISDARALVAQVDIFLGMVKRSLPELPSKDELSTLPSLFSNMYTAFEETFRGSKNAVKDRLKPYLDDIAHIEQGSEILDIGFGRGELLEILTDAGFNARGIDTNEISVEAAKARGLAATHADARTYLSEVPERSLGAIFAIHVVEHVETDDLIEIIDLALRALQPGGVLVFETPNPENIGVGANSFYLDPTHHHPIPPLLLKFLVGARGFADVDIRYLSRHNVSIPNPSTNEGNSHELQAVIDVINDRFFNAEDYAIVARRL